MTLARFIAEALAERSFEARRLILGCVALLVLSPGCIRRDGVNRTGTSDKGEASLPSFDVRGGENDSDVYLGKRTVFEGKGGPGGSLRITTSGGGITMSNSALVGTAQAPAFSGSGFDVAPGQKRTVAGAETVNWLRVQDGGTLTLLEDTLFVVLGDVLIAGRIDGGGDKHAIDGRDLTIDADGIINITGTIDCSGYVVKLDDVAPSERNDFPGGHGGEIYISSAETTTISVGPHIFISGRILSNGGDTFSQDLDTARPGSGGQILIGSFGKIAMDGRIAARGGKAYLSADGSEGRGGSIELVAVSNFEIARVKEVNASGGNSSGPEAGDGGTVLLEGPVGTLDLVGFDIECRGGRTTFAEAGVGGVGGTVTLTAADLTLGTMKINVSGGDAVEERKGEGGDGGTAQLAGSSSITVGQGVAITADGGETKLPSTHGGAGGNVKIVNLDESNLAALDFEGSATVEGGKDFVSSTGSDGVICVAGSNSASNIQLVGTNNFPISGCGSSDMDTLIVHNLDCDDATITPDEVDTSLPVVIGVDFFRVVKTAGMVADGVTTVTVATTGESGGNLDLYTGPAAALGSTNVGSYTQSSTEADSDETIDVDVSGLAAGQFFSVMVVEQSTFVEEYSITVACQ